MQTAAEKPVATTNSRTGKWVWRPRWSTFWRTTAKDRGRPGPPLDDDKDDEPLLEKQPASVDLAGDRSSGPVRQRKKTHRRRSAISVSSFTLLAVTLLLFLITAIEDAQALGFFELQILEIENYRGQLATGECCGGVSSVQPSSAANKLNAQSLHCAGAPQCNTLFRVCLREYQSRQPSSAAAAANGGRTVNGGDDESSFSGIINHQPNSDMHHCSFGNVTSAVLGGNSFTLGGDAVAVPDSSSDNSNRGAAVGNLALPFSFSWTRSFTFILQAMDYSNYTGTMSVIEEATYSGILLPGNEWKALSHLGHTARMAYRVRVRCDRNYYGQTCTKLCKPRDDRFGHYTCGDTDGRKECIPGWQGENCDKAVCKTGCHPVHGKCDYPGGCECRKGWQGELCDQCMTYPGCKHGYCNGTSWQCICDVNWGGILCDQDLNYCGTHEPCLNGGTCKSTAPDRYTCTCPEGFGGANCDVVLNPCATEPCANGGKCRTVDAGGVGPGGAAAGGSAVSGSAAQPPLLVPKQFHCDCRPGWTGSTCNTEIDECATQPPRCVNGGTCVDLVADWRCDCPDDRWRGRRCEIDVDECERQNRERQPSAAEQQCGPNAVLCRTTQSYSAATTDCVCRRGWTVASTKRDGNNNNLTAYIGCTVNVDDCAGPDVKCANGGTCLDLIGGYACACPAGYTGRNCRTQIDPCGGDEESIAAGAGNPCKNGGECVAVRRWRSGGVAGGSSSAKQQQIQTYSCICQLGYTGENCEIDRDHCTPNPCRNGGQCLNTPDDYYCQCSGDGWSWHGKNCTVPADAGAAGPSKTTGTTTTVTTAKTTTTTVSTTTISTTDARPPPTQTLPPLKRTTTLAPVAAIRRPGVTSSGTNAWRQQHSDEDVVNKDGVAVCSSRHRPKHWSADDGCNECKCVKSVTADDAEGKATGSPVMMASCTNLWCGPATYDCLSDGASCSGPNQVCVPVVDDEDLLDEDSEKRRYVEGSPIVGPDPLILWRQCLRPPCGGIDRDRDRDDIRLRYGYDDENDEDAAGGDVGDEDRAYVAVGSWPRRRRRGQCATTVADDDDYADDADGSPITVWPSAVRHCLPNRIGIDKHMQQSHRRRRAGTCGRLRVTLDPARLRRGTRVSAVCHSLRRLLARAWVRDDEDGLQSHGEDEHQDRRNRVYVMCEAVPNEDRRRRRRRITIRVTVASIVDKQQQQRRTKTTDAEDEDNISAIVQTLYKRLNSGVAVSTAASSVAKKVPATGHRLRTTSNNGGGSDGDEYDDAAALAFLSAAIVDVAVGAAALVDPPSSPAPANASGPPTDDYRNYYYYYWTGGVACGALATVLAAAAFLLFRFRSSTRRKIGGEQSGSSAATAIHGESSAANIDCGGGGGDGLMLSLVRRQNEENLKRLVTGGNRNSTGASMGADYVGGCGRNNLSAGSSLSCSRVSIVHPLCNAATADDGSSPLQQRKQLMDASGDSEGMMDANDDKARDKTNVAASPLPAPVQATVRSVAAIRSVAVAVAVPRQQQRPVSVAAAPQQLMLCKKTLNVDNDRRLQQHQQQQHHHQQQQQIILQQQQQHQQMLQQHQQQQQQHQNMVTQYNHRRDVRNPHAQYAMTPNNNNNNNNSNNNNNNSNNNNNNSNNNSNNNNNNNNNSGNNSEDGGGDLAAPPSLTVLV